MGLLNLEQESQPAFGFFPQMKPRRSKQDPEAAKNAPVDLGRGFVAGTLGAPGDLEALVRMATGGKQILPTSNYIESKLPFKSDTPVSNAAAGLGQVLGGFYTGPGSGFNAISTVGSALAKATKGLPVGASIKPVEYPQAQALETARKNAVKMLGLPEKNTAMDRAKALGFVDAYHGTAHDISRVDPGMFGASTGAKSAKQAFWAVDDPTVARGYAEYAANQAPVKRLLDQADKAEKLGKWDKYDDLVAKAEALEAQVSAQPLNGQNIMPLMIRANRGVRGAEMDAKGAEFVDLEGGVNRLLNQAARDKRDIAVIRNLSDDVGRNGIPATHFAALNPSVVRSRFAAFDPARVNENNLLASIAGAAVGIPLFTMGQGLLTTED